jgi:hypothetical protein
MSRKSRGRTARLITWDWAGQHAAVPAREVVAAVLRPQTSSRTVKKFVELLYAAREYDPIDKLAALTHNPYTATYGTVVVEQNCAAAK